MLAGPQPLTSIVLVLELFIIHYSLSTALLTLPPRLLPASQPVHLRHRQRERERKISHRRHIQDPRGGRAPRL